MAVTTDYTVFIALLTFTGVITAAIITAVTAHIRQQQQLKHDRTLKDLAELRGVLDEATVIFQETIHQAQNIFAGLGKRPYEKEGKLAEEWPELMTKGEFGKEMRRLGDDRDRMFMSGRRIVIRVGRDQDIYATYQSAIDLVVKIIRELYAENTQQKSGDTKAKINSNQLSDELLAHRDLLADQAAALIGSHLPKR